MYRTISLSHFLSPAHFPSTPLTTHPLLCSGEISAPSHTTSALSALPPPATFAKMPIDVATSVFNSCLSQSLNSLCPLVSKPARLSLPSPWLTDSLRSSRTMLQAAERKWRKSRSPDDLASYHTLLAAFIAATTSAKTSFFQSKIDACVSNPCKLFSTFSSLSAGDFLTHFEGKVAVIWNSFTHPVIPHIPHTEPIATLSSFKILEDSDVLQLVTRHRATTCPLDPIHSAVLQSISAELLPYLSSIINTSLICDHVPAAFKTARVTPLLKKPSLDPSDVRNYRPVSLLPFLSKTIECAVLNQLSVFLHQNNLLDPHQSGFRTGHSTEIALLAMTEALATARASSLSSVLILLYLSAAFDTVNHKLLISTLAEMAISGTALSWFVSYLTDPTKSPGRVPSLLPVPCLQESRRDLYWVLCCSLCILSHLVQ
ncbi:hypothetical protein SKAU_G00414470 [Synaphobranchus kaupii]|uniref:Reverse transcriptase domain-containing protein n=1 Tax=Synaphobranchus kaupii TaxID=118154 RepID=A0A9Q1E717_SYNKA|nr:hypothetical protein SKAU_G00414470 [Synaphobranchus kaupii]